MSRQGRASEIWTQSQISCVHYMESRACIQRICETILQHEILFYLCGALYSRSDPFEDVIYI